jgi:hypothetical protein
MALVRVDPPRASHRPECRFGPGYWRLVLRDGSARYVQSELEIETVRALLPGEIARVQRDGFCLDEAEYPNPNGDANTPDVIDGEQWLALDQRDGMQVLGILREADYRRVYDAVEAAVYRRDNLAAQGGVRASIILKRPGAHVIDA